MNIKIILILLTIVVAGGGIYHVTVHDQLADDIAKSNAANAKMSEHLNSDWNTPVHSKPAPLPGQD